MKVLAKLMGRFRRDERGVTLVEYGIALILAVALGTGALVTLGNEVGFQMDAAADHLPDS